MSGLNGAELLSFFVVCCVKATVVLACAWGIVAVVRQRASAAQRHHIWAVAIVALLGLPLFAMLLPSWQSAAIGNAAAHWIPVRANAVGSIGRTIPPSVVHVEGVSPVFAKIVVAVLLVWALGFLAILSRIFVGLVRLAWVSAKSEPIFDDGWMRTVLELSGVHRISRSVRILRCRNPLAMPLTWGMIRPLIVLPSSATEWSEERRRMVLSHELAHIARHDWLLQICSEIARAIYWFHPLVWLAAARLRQESERASDDAVLASGVEASQYASQLLDLARTLRNPGRAWATALAIARPSNLERRFAAMLNPSMNRNGLSLRTKCLIPLFALGLLVPLAALRLSAQNFAGKVSGTIHDPSGASVPNATIIMSNQTAGTIDMTASDRDGNFVFKTLPTGEYEMKVVKPGFEAYLVPHVSLGSGRDFSQAIMLRLGAITDRLDVVAGEGSKVTPVETKSGKTSRLQVGGSVEAAKLITKVNPTYPDSAKSAGISGTVVLHAVIGMDGKPLSLKVVNSQIDPDLARSAVEAISQWRYTPTLLNGEPVEVDTTVSVVYSLQP